MLSRGGKVKWSAQTMGPCYRRESALCVCVWERAASLIVGAERVDGTSRYIIIIIIIISPVRKHRTQQCAHFCVYVFQAKKNIIWNLNKQIFL